MRAWQVANHPDDGFAQGARAKLHESLPSKKTGVEESIEGCYERLALRVQRALRLDSDAGEWRAMFLGPSPEVGRECEVQLGQVEDEQPVGCEIDELNAFTAA